MKKYPIRVSTLTSLAFAIMAGGALFWVSQQVQILEHNQRKLQQEISSQQEGIRVLNAEWDYLNRPDRLEALVASHLTTMAPQSPEDLLRDVNSIPEPLFAEEERTILISGEEKIKKDKKNNKVLAVPDARPIITQSKDEGVNFNQVIDKVIGDNE